MAVDFSLVEATIADAVGRVFPAAQVEVRLRDEIVFSRAFGWLDPETRQWPTRGDTLFDLASLSKLFVAIAFMTLVEAGIVALDQPVCTVVPEFSGLRPIHPYEDPLHPGAFVEVVPAPPGQEHVDARQVTFRHLLTHTSGLPAWRPLYQQGDPLLALRMAIGTHFAYPTGARVVYSDLGMILIGVALERLTGMGLDRVVRERVTDPLGMQQTCYRPIDTPGVDLSNIAPTEQCAWRRRRILGEVHDENAASLGGIAGHAGIFSTAAEVALFGQLFLDAGRPLLQPASVAEMTRLQAQDGVLRRGIGWVLWSPDPEMSGYPFSQDAFGHTGFTGTSLWVDPQRELVVACLTNDVYYGREHRSIIPFRVALHRAIVTAVDKNYKGTKGIRLEP